MKKIRAGFTLMELIITMSFIGIISTTIVTVYLTGFTTFQEELAGSTVQSDAQTILDSMLLDIKNGILIETTYGGYTTDADTVIVQVPAIDNNKRIIYSGTSMLFDRIVYNYNGSSIHKVIFADSSSSRYKFNNKDEILDKNILALNFAYDPDQSTATLVTATLTSKVNAGLKHQRSITLTGEARLRNHI